MKHKISYQEGSVRKKGNNYYYRFRMEESDGTMKMHEFAGTRSKRETEAMLKKAIEEYNELGKILDPGDITVSELMDEWFRTEIEPSSRATTTLDSYRNVMDHVRSHRIGKMKLKEVTVEALQAYVDEKYFGEYDENGKEIKHAYSDSTMKEEFVVLNGIFRYAVYPKEYLKSSPMQHVKKRKKPEEANIFGDEDEKLEIITHDEYKQIIEFLGTHKNSYGDDYRYMILPVQISYYTGLRAGELAGLCWDDIDLPGRRLVVRRSMFKDTGTKNWELKVPKNRKQRVVDFGETLANILTKAKTQQESDRKLYGELYQKHYCQTQSIKGRPHNIVFIIALPKELMHYDPDELLRYFVESFRKEYNTECIAALHHNHDRTNYHIHMIYSERQQLEEPIRKIATRNMYFDPNGKHVRTKKEATTDGKLLPGYTMIPKGEVYEERFFDKKNPAFKQKSFTNDAKLFLTNLMNRQLSERNQMMVFPKDSPFLPTKKIGKNNPKEEFIKETNHLRDEWNNEIWHAYQRGAPKEGLMTAKQELISKPVAESIAAAGGKSDPDKYNNILARAISVVKEMCRILSREGRDTWAEAWGKAITKLMDMATERLAGRTLDIKKDTKHRTMER